MAQWICADAVAMRNCTSTLDFRGWTKSDREMITQNSFNGKLIKLRGSKNIEIDFTHIRQSMHL